MKSLRWFDYAILICLALSIAIGGAALDFLYASAPDRGVMDGAQ